MLLSICIAGKNDNLHRNYLWRLKTTIDRYSNLIANYGLDAEIVFLDWGSKVKIKDVIQCNPKFVRWLYVPSEITSKIDSPFAGSIAYNACMKRAKGDFVLHCDSESFMSNISFVRMMQYLFYTKELGKVNSQVVGLNRICIPEPFCSKCPTEYEIINFISDTYKEPARTDDRDIYKNTKEQGFGGGMAGILIGKEAFCDSTGWDERHIHWGWSDIEHNKRLSWKLKMFQSLAFGFVVFHLNHQRPTELADHKCNNNIEPTMFKANDEKTWGLADLNLEDL